MTIFLFLLNLFWQNLLSGKIYEKPLLREESFFRINEFKKDDFFDFLKIKDETISAKGVIVKEFEGKILYEKNAQVSYSLASLTKLLSSYLALEKFNFNDNFVFDRDTLEKQETNGKFSVGEKVKLFDLLAVSLISSNNEAIYLLAKTYGLSKFIEELNQTLNSWGFKETKIFEPTGLDPQNISTPREFAELIFKIYSRRPEIFYLTQREYIEVNGKRFWTTNLILRKYNKIIIGAKTGYLPKIGENFALLLKFPNSPFIAVVILNSQNRFQDAEIIIKALAAYYRYEL